MSDQTLSFRFVGDDSSLSTSSQKAVKALEDVQGATGKVSQALAQATQKISQSAGAMGGSIKKGTGEATQSLINLSRVAQDAPYGFIGIANNLNPLLESFERLKASTGSVGGSLKALSAELIGGGGIGLALGVASSLMVVFGNNLFSTGNAAKTQADKLKEATQALNDYVDSLTDVDKSRLKGLQSAQDELIKLQSLYDATQNANIPLAQRKKLVDQLQEQYPKYFGNIKDEIVLTGGAQVAYEKLAKAIIAVATAEAFKESIKDKKKEQIALEREHKDKLVELKTAQDAFVKSQQAAAKFAEKSAPGAVSVSSLQRSLGESEEQKKFNKAIKETGEHQEKINKVIREQKDLYAELNKTIQQTPELLLNPTGDIKNPKGDGKKANDELKKQLEEKKQILIEFIKDFQAIQVPFPALSKPLENFNAKDLADELQKKLGDALVKIAPIKYKLPLKIEAVDIKDLPKAPVQSSITNQTDQGAKNNLENFRKIGEQIGEKIGPGFSDVFGKIFSDALTEAIKNGLSGDALTSFQTSFEAFSQIAAESVGGIASAFGDFTDALFEGKNAMQSFGNALVGTFKAIAKQIVVDIVLAGALSALSGGAANGGVSFIGAFKGLIAGSHASGLYRVPKDNYVANLHKGEMVVPAKLADAFRSMTTPNFSKLLMPTFSMATGAVNTSSLVKATEKYGSVTGGGDQKIIIEGRIRGKDIAFVNHQTLKSQRRAT